MVFGGNGPSYLIILNHKYSFWGTPKANRDQEYPWRSSRALGSENNQIWVTQSIFLSLRCFCPPILWFTINISLNHQPLPTIRSAHLPQLKSNWWLFSLNISEKEKRVPQATPIHQNYLATFITISVGSVALCDLHYMRGTNIWLNKAFESREIAAITFKTMLHYRVYQGFTPANAKWGLNYYHKCFQLQDKWINEWLRTQEKAQFP